MLSEIYALDATTPILSGNEAPTDYQNKLKEVSKSEDYRKFVTQKLQPAEIASSLIGNLYTGSIFMGFLSTLAHFANTDAAISGKKFGFLAYGSGSKSKVFEGTIQDGWELVVAKTQLFATLEQSHEIEFKNSRIMFCSQYFFSGVL
jgi:hydroxymethylglutaryl-CoA synthase